MSDLQQVYDFVNNLGLPLAIIAFIGLVTWKLLPSFKEWIMSNNQAQQHRMRHDGEMTELIRNNTAVIENCTAALEMHRHQSETTIRVLGKHMDEERERGLAIQIKAEELSKQCDRIITDTSLMKDKQAIIMESVMRHERNQSA